ncbi:MAG: hypothetical protein Q8M54_04350 [Desulfobaccales bacterium]|nr:hypothetical protein [Desulfobaccales bacterium]
MASKTANDSGGEGHAPGKGFCLFFPEFFRVGKLNLGHDGSSPEESSSRQSARKTTKRG